MQNSTTVDKSPPAYGPVNVTQRPRNWGEIPLWTASRRALKCATAGDSAKPRLNELDSCTELGPQPDNFKFSA